MADIDDLSGRMLGEFVLRERIDEGGFGAVYRCVQPLLGRDAVVKVLHRQLRRRDVALQRFMREAQLASRLDHPYAAHVYAFGVEEDGLLWIAMELVQGTTLDRWLQARGPLAINQLVPFFDRVAEVVHVAHEAGIVHRDLKPSNMMVVERAGQLLPKLLDFGVAKLLDGARAIEEQATAPIPRVDLSDEPSERSGRDGASTRSGSTSSPPSPGAGRPLTHAGARIGSPPYMAPEQWTEPTAVGRSADIYALGIIAYEALAGRRPFNANTADEYAELHLGATAAPLGGDFAPALDKVLGRALAKRPEDRYASALDLAAALRAALQAHVREQLRVSARQWEDQARPDGLLWSGRAAATLDGWLQRTPAGVLNELEHSFVAAGRRQVRRTAWMRRALLAAAVATGIAGVAYRAALQTRAAERIAASAITQAEVEEGRQALLHDDPGEAALHLGEAYRRGAREPGVAFMLARALQPQLAEQVRVPSSAGRMWTAAFSPDGRRILTTDDQAAQVRDARDGRLLFTLPHGDSVYHAVYSADGARIVTACGDGAVRIWDAASGALLRKLERADRRPRYGLVAATVDGRLIAAIDKLGAAADVWDATTGAELAQFHLEGAEWPSVAFSADGHWLAISGGDAVHLIVTNGWREVAAITGPRIRGLAFDPAGARLVTGAADGDVAIWAVPSGSRLHHLREVGEPISAVAFAPSGELVAAVARDGTAQVWDARDGALKSQGNHLHGKALSVEFDRASRLVLAAGAGGSVAVADAISGSLVAVLQADGLVNVAHFDPTGTRVVGASAAGAAYIWDATAPYQRWNAPAAATDCGIATSLSPDQRFVAIGCRDQATRIWDTARDQLVAELPAVMPVNGDFTSALPAVSAGGDRAAIARGDAVELYELPSGRLLQRIVHGAPVNAVAFAAAGRDLVSGGVDGSLVVTRDRQEPVRLPTSPGGIDSAALLADGRVIAADARGRMHVFAAGGGELAELELPSRAQLLRPSPDGRRLVTIGVYTGRTAAPALLDLEHYVALGQLEGHVGRVFSARFVARDQVLTSGGDGTARRWDAGAGRLLQTFRGAPMFLADATVSPDGTMVVAGGGDGVVRFWDAASARPLWTMPAHGTAVIGLHFEGDDLVTRGFGAEVARWRLPKSGAVLGARGIFAR